MLVYPKDAEFKYVTMGDTLIEEVYLPNEWQKYYHMIESNYFAFTKEMCVAVSYQEGTEVKIAYCTKFSKSKYIEIQEYFCDALQILAIDYMKISDLPEGTIISETLHAYY